MGKISQTWTLMSESWSVLKQEKNLLVFPLLSCVCCLLLLASFAIPIFATGAWHLPKHDAAPVRQVMYYGTLFAFYVANYFIVIFFNAAVVACTAMRLEGETPTFRAGLRVAASRLPVIAGWALVAATVGLVLRIAEDRSDKVGQFVAGLLGVAWSAMSFLVVPILVVENKGPIAALRESTGLLRKTWGQQLVCNFSFGFIFFLLSLPGIALLFLGFHWGSAIGFTCLGLAVVYWILLSLIHSTLQTIFQTALFLYARDGHVEGFSSEVLEGALR